MDFSRTQLEAVEALEHAIRRGARAGCDSITWTVGYDGVTGHISSIGAGVDAANTLFDRWVDALSAKRFPDRRGRAGATERVACAENVVLRAELHA